MGRSRTYDEQQVLQDAMGLFWRQGFRASSIKELEHATGLNPGSLYHAYGSKHGLFLRVLDAYVDNVIAPRVRTHLKGDCPQNGIREFMVSAFDPAPGFEPGMACLLVNTAVEMGREDEEILRRLMRGFRMIDRGLRSQIEAAQERGELPCDRDARSLARQIGVSFQGILVASRINHQRGRLVEMTDAALAALH